MFWTVSQELAEVNILIEKESQGVLLALALEMRRLLASEARLMLLIIGKGVCWLGSRMLISLLHYLPRLWMTARSESSVEPQRQSLCLPITRLSGSAALHLDDSINDQPERWRCVDFGNGMCTAK